MTDDKELIARLRSMHWCVTTKANGVGVSDEAVAPEAADRIEALTEQLAAARRDAEEAEAYAGELEANGLANRVAIMRLEARNARLVEALRVNAAILEAERNRTGGEPFTGKWSFAENEGRYTVSEALDLARATLAEIKGHDDE